MVRVISRDVPRRMKPSAFNVPVRLGDGRLAYLNTVTNNFLVPYSKCAEILGGNTPVVVVPGEVVDAIEGGFLVDEAVDEVTAIRYGFEKSRLSGSEPHLTVAPTLDCNFGCEYCFETHRKGHMTEQTQDALLEFLETAMVPASEFGRTLGVTWFGGEPLMAMRVIRRFSQGLEALERSGVLDGWTSDIVTNAFLLRRALVDELVALRITSVQVTLDGSRDLHDRRRFLKAGRRPSFDAILQNLVSARGRIPVNIRVNADASNIGTVDELFEQLDQLHLLEWLTVEVSRVEPFRLEDFQSGSEILSAEEFAAWEIEALDRAVERGWPLQVNNPQPRIFGVCQVDRTNAFVVGPTGDLMRCWAELGNKPHVVGRLSDRASWSKLAPTPLTERDPFDDPECVSCRVLPLCMGSCPILRQNRRTFGMKECPPFKHNLDKLATRRYAGKTSISRRILRVAD